jgi:predicted ATPase
MLQALIQMAGYHERRGDYAQTQRYASHQLELDPWREEAHRLLMRVLAVSGQRSAALEQYERCRRVLAAELGVEPAQETTALYERIRDTGSAELSAQRDETQYVQNFPAQTTALIGREAELAELGALLENPTCRLITIVGPGGIGKTRLALAAAAEQATAFTYGAVFVPLAAISSAGFLALVILSAFDIALQGQRDPRDQLLDYLREKELLLVLDNFEQLLAPGPSQDEGAAELLANVLHHAPGVTLLVTSRERLALPGEWLFDLSGLSYPPGEPLNGIENYSAVRLFVQRAGQVRRQFALVGGEARAVSRICRLVEGLPLAIELAAAALRTRSVTAVAEAIETSIMALTSGLRAVPERHRSMWATFEHSWRLLSDDECQVFARLSVFRSGFEEQAAVQVAQATPQLLAALLDKSLLRWDGVARYDVHELVRQYAGEKLEQAGEVEGTKNKHVMYYLGLVEAAEPMLHSAARGSWLEPLDREYDNLRTALAWSQGPLGSAETGLRLAAAMGGFWWAHGYLREGRAWLVAALTQPGADAPSLARARALHWAGSMASFQGDIEARRVCLDECLALYRVLGDRRRSAGLLADLGIITLWEGDHTQAAALFEESLALFRELGDRSGIAYVQQGIATIARDQCDFDRAHALYAESLAVWRDLKDKSVIADALNIMGDAMRQQGDYIRAAAVYQEALALSEEAGDLFHITLVRSNLGRVAHAQGDDAQALALLEASVAWFRDAGHTWGLMWVLHHLSAVVYAQGDDVRTTALLREGLGLQQRHGQKRTIAGSLECFAGLAARQGHPARAARLFGAAAALREAIDTPLPPSECAAYDRDVASARVQLDEATFAAAWAEGRVMTLEQAIAYALEVSAAESEQLASAAATAQQSG